jgi:hypothetical protein
MASSLTANAAGIAGAIQMQRFVDRVYTLAGSIVPQSGSRLAYLD